MPETRRTMRAPWEKIKADYEEGIPVDDLAIKWQIKGGTLRSRASREQWKTPNRIKKAADSFVAMVQGSSAFQKELARLQQDATSDGSNRSVLQPGAAKSGDVAGYQSLVAEMAMSAVCSGLSKVKRPANWREIATADTIARRALGLDSKGGASAVSMVRISGPNGATVDVATSAHVDVEEVDEDWDD